MLEAQPVTVVIEPQPDGPLLVTGLPTLLSADGSRLDTKEVTALCRCGGSQNKPFCDGTHRTNGFSSAHLGGGAPDRRADYVGELITIHDNRGLCAHVGVCTSSLPEVWNSKRRPWIDPRGAGVDAIIETIRGCPSGALSYSMAGVEHRDLPREPAILVTANGPYYVTGGIELAGATFGQGASREHYALCRCGQSKRKPFCDGAHWDIGFTA